MRSIAPMILLALLLAVGTPAHAQGTLNEAARALDSNPVYVDESAERALTNSEVERLRDQIGERGAGPLYLVVLPESASDEAGGDPSNALREIAQELREPGTYAGVIGNSFRAGSVGVDVPASELARDSLDARGTDGTFAVLSDFIARVGEARAGGGGSSGGGGDGGGGFPWFLALLIGLPLAAIALGRRRQRRRAQEHERAQLEDVRQVAREDLVALGDDIRALDLDVQMPDADPEGKQHYHQAVERYTEAEEALDRAQRAEDIERVTSALEEGRWAMTAAKAELAGRQAPERRPPCFFDPRHGPSVGDVEWAPPGGQPRPVPVCAADLQRIQDGLDPESRHVPMDGQMVPYWAAGPAYMPWAGGFFGAGLLPGLLLGSMLGGGFGMFGGGAAEGGGDFGDFGGGDLGDFGGGDFGDFGGGGDF
ncbi:MAG TPA: hypothetical protein VFM57_05725 [Thermoleophilaceae bacterium]|nr:hypothetical protein [Thermoleophilaceae bacterium]